jgi:hypothetical protein
MSGLWRSARRDAIYSAGTTAAISDACAVSGRSKLATPPEIAAIAAQ